MTALDATGAGFTASAEGSFASGSQQLVFFLGLAGASQQLFGAGGGTSGLPQQHPVSAFSTGAHAQPAEAHPAPDRGPASAHTGNATSGAT